jgi:hypothetical protein
MRIVTPERWYIAFWLLMGLGFLACQYWVIRMAVADGVADVLGRPERHVAVRHESSVN